MENNIYNKRDREAEDLEKQKQSIREELHKLDLEIKKRNKKKFIIITSCVIIPIILFKIFIKEINIGVPNLFLQHKRRLYSVELNKKSVSLDIEEYKTVRIIPFFIKYTVFDRYTPISESDNNYIELKKGGKINLIIDSYECYDSNNNNLVSCSESPNITMKKMFDTNYNLTIRKSTKGEKMFYEGKFKNNIGDFFKETGSYFINITGTYKNVKSDIVFYIKIKENE